MVAIESTTSPDARLNAVTRVLVVDDHELLRDGIIELLANEPQLEVCGEAAGENEAMEFVREQHPNLLIVDVALAQGNGISLIKRIKAHDESIRAIVCSMYDEGLYASRALRAGAWGYVHKQAPAQAVLDAVREVLAGNVYLSPRMTKRLVNATHAGSQPDSSPVERLTDRELEVFTLIGQGLMNAQIADELHLSPRTVETYRERLKTKLDLKTSGELNRRAVQWVLEGE